MARLALTALFAVMLLSGCWQSAAPLMPYAVTDVPKLALSYIFPGQEEEDDSVMYLRFADRRLDVYSNAALAGEPSYRVHFDYLGHDGKLGPGHDWYVAQINSNGSDGWNGKTSYKAVRVDPDHVVASFDLSCSSELGSVPGIVKQRATCVFSDYSELVARANIAIVQHRDGKTDSDGQPQLYGEARYVPAR